MEEKRNFYCIFGKKGEIGMIKVKYVWIVNFSTPKVIKNHVHNCYEIIYYLNADGHCDYFPRLDISSNPTTNIDYLEQTFAEYEKDVFKFYNNSLILFTPHTVHNEVHNRKAKVIDIGFELDNDDMNLSNLLCKDNSTTLLNIFQKIEHEYINKSKYYQTAIEALVLEAIVEIARINKEDSKKDNPIIFAKNYIKEYFSTDIDLDNLAALSGYSPEHFRYLFNQVVGISPKSYIIKKRINYACKLLVDTNFSIQKISILCGYEDFSQFSIIFKNKTGLTPSKYRKTHQ